jgi:hypothetical protein
MACPMGRRSDRSKKILLDLASGKSVSDTASENGVTRQWVFFVKDREKKRWKELENGGVSQ